MAKKHAFTILRITYAIVHQVPVHTVGAGIARVTSVTALPILETMGGVIETTFAPIAIGFLSVGV